jgi:hypothetical protein
MKTNLNSNGQSGYALLTVLVMSAISLVILAATVRRTSGVANLNERNNLYLECQNAAESAVEKVVARMSYDFHASGVGAVANNLSIYRGYTPTVAENSYWANFQFSDGSTAGKTSVQMLTNYSGPMPSQFPGLQTMTGPIYRIRSVASRTEGGNTVSATIQQDLLLALVPLPQWAIFGNAKVEFSTCAAMTVNGRVHVNNDLWVGTSASLDFNGAVTTTGTVTAPGYGTDPTKWGTDFNAGYATNRPTVSLNFNTTNAHSLIEIPPASVTPTSDAGKQLLYNNANVVLLVSNTLVTLRVQTAPNTASVPGADPSPVELTSTNTPTALAANFPFLTLTNKFIEPREASKTNLLTQIDIAKYGTWIKTNNSVKGKYPSGTYPTVLYVADNRTVNSKQMTSVRVANAASLPENGGVGFSLATPNPLYVWGHYNCTNSSYLGTTNTTATVPSALMSDAVTVLSPKWADSTSTSKTSADPTTVNACLMAGMVPSTGTFTKTSDFQNGKFSGGIHNYTRLLENWSGKNLTLNTSILYLYTSQSATNQFKWPGTYYDAPTRQFSYDLNFMRLDRQPPGIPTALVATRVNWSTQ